MLFGKRTAARRLNCALLVAALAGVIGFAFPKPALGQALKPVAFNFPPRDFTCSAQLIASGDFNNDGYPDLICLGDAYSILLGDGHGGFKPAISFPLTVQVRVPQAALADLNGDGNLDVIVLFGNNPLLFVFLGNGDGTFQAPLTIEEFTYNSSAMATGDVNGDGKLDLIVMEDNVPLAAIFLGNGDGTFRDGGTIPLPEIAISPALVDLNGDGALDLAVSGSGRFVGFLMVALGNGDGTFKPATSSALPDHPGDLLVGDFNEDGKVDLIVGSNPSQLLLGKGDGTFRRPAPILPGLSSSGWIAADFNHDGKLDIAAQLSNQNKVEIFLGDGRGGFSSLASFPIADSTSGYSAQGLLAGYFNDDANLDLLVGGPAAEVVSVLFGKGDGTFLLPSRFDDPNLSDVTTGDVNGDGRLDIVSINSKGALGVLLGNGDATFQKANYFPAATGPGGIGLGDFNGDGNLDAVVTCDSGYIAVLPGRGEGSFGPPITTPAGSAQSPPTSVAVGDFNGDGILDVAINNPSEIFLGKGNGRFQPPIPYFWDVGYVEVHVADLNGDGRLDLVVLQSTSGLEAFSDIAVLLGNGDGTFQSPLFIAVDPYAESFAIADLNRDGIPDVTVTTAVTINVMLGNGDGTFQPYTSYYSGVGSSGVSIADFNLDGWPDLAVTASDESTAFIMINRGDGTFRLGSTFMGVPPQSFHLLAEDFNGDGKPDLAVANTNVIFVYTNTTPWRE